MVFDPGYHNGFILSGRGLTGAAAAPGRGQGHRGARRPSDAGGRAGPAGDDQVVSCRHGTRRRPVLHAGLDADSPLGQLLEEFRGVRADLRFGHDGLHTAVTIERQGPLPGRPR
jgi:hypothetical protein